MKFARSVVILCVIGLSGCGPSEEETREAVRKELRAEASASASAAEASQSAAQAEEELLAGRQASCEARYEDYEAELENIHTTIASASVTRHTLKFMGDEVLKDLWDKTDPDKSVDSWCDENVKANLRASHDDLIRARKAWDRCVAADTCRDVTAPINILDELESAQKNWLKGQDALENYGS